ncbi:hypothetical protein [Kosakonia pseudosacchari]|uniref:hypothetical protein n=1 Tax=Kosakonia pseudosacchari TaxID=1646340 RepID=UPI000A3617E0|nr:hypothetical protein [Kosakonia pseudosacchari]
MIENDYFTITANCERREECIYNNEREIPVVVTIKNISSKGFYIPLKFIEKTGPGVELVDHRTKKSMPLRPNIANWDLKKEMTYIPVNGSVSFKWAILDAEISSFIVDGSVDVVAVFSVLTNVYDSERTDVGEFISSTRLIITGKDLDEDKH